MIYEAGRQAQTGVVAGRCVVELIRLRDAPMVAHGIDETLRGKLSPGVARQSCNECQTRREGAEDTNLGPSEG